VQVYPVKLVKAAYGREPTIEKVKTVFSKWSLVGQQRKPTNEMGRHNDGPVQLRQVAVNIGFSMMN